MDLELILRPAGAGDAEEIAEVFLAARRDALAYLPSLHTDDEVRTWIRDTVIPGTNVWVAESEGTIAGFFSLKDERLEHLYVRPDHQGSGVGTALLGKARALSPERLELYTFLRNQGARRFYERHGFHAIAFGRDNEENEPDVLYEWVPADTR